ncbi:MAG: dihydrofolate synthase / folylpolyglutamate synthase [Solirubrobacterales bacterium]|jgi:dihydrofolate synthase/folylpolyglutamate synthase|nr:dihydrofolate synthase / folylpolyglutamate synthase [Solirubrobacterales bacterium]
MHRLSTALGMPQHRFASIHVVGTNGKSSVTRMTAALLQAHGLRTGACVSPHPTRWSERVLLDGETIDAAAFSAAVERAAQGAETVNRSLDEGEMVTQFELATAAAFVAFAAARVDAAVIEAGLGGRLDATNTIPSQVTVLTSIGLDHTAWLGDTELEIAAEKLAVLRDHTTLVVGRVRPEVMRLAQRTAEEHGARLIVAPENPPSGLELRVAGPFQRRNFALAEAATRAFLGDLDRDKVSAVAASLTVPGRLERVASNPTTFIDVAHNPDGAAALAEALVDVAAGRFVIACIAALADKDAEAMVRALAPKLELAVCTELDPAVLESRGLPGIASHSAAKLAAACAASRLSAEQVPDFNMAVRRGRDLAAGLSDGVLLITGSHYVLAPARVALRLCEDSGDGLGN